MTTFNKYGLYCDLNILVFENAYFYLAKQKSSVTQSVFNTFKILFAKLLSAS